MSKGIILMLTSAITIGGSIAKKGELVEVSEVEAKNLLHRGKAVIHDVQPESDDDVDLKKFNKDQLVDMANELEIDSADKLNKAQLIEAITAKQSEQDGE